MWILAQRTIELTNHPGIFSGWVELADIVQDRVSTCDVSMEKGPARQRILQWNTRVGGTSRCYVNWGVNMCCLHRQRTSEATNHPVEDQCGVSCYVGRYDE